MSKIPDSGLTALLLQRFGGERLTPETCIAVEHAVREHLREMLIGIDDNPPISVRVEINIHNMGRGLNVQALNFFTFLAMNGVAVDHRRVEGKAKFVSGGVTFQDFGLGSYGITLDEPVGRDGANGNYYFGRNTTQYID